MITREKARALRHLIEVASQSLPDADALQAVELFPHWSATDEYFTEDRVCYDGTLYKCLQAHTAQADWTPDMAVSLWVRVDDPSIEYPEWRQPTGATDAYRLGAKVSHLGKHWLNTIDYNTYEPSVYGWDEV